MAIFLGLPRYFLYLTAIYCYYFIVDCIMN